MLWFDDWKSKMKGRPTSRGIGRPQPAAVGIDNRLADRQPDSHTMLLCREILGKHLINQARVDAWACVPDLDFDRSVLAA
jgi:hypothetical protein